MKSRFDDNALNGSTDSFNSEPNSAGSSRSTSPILDDDSQLSSSSSIVTIKTIMLDLDKKINDVITELNIVFNTLMLNCFNSDKCNKDFSLAFIVVMGKINNIIANKRDNIVNEFETITTENVDLKNLNDKEKQFISNIIDVFKDLAKKKSILSNIITHEFESDEYLNFMKCRDELDKIIQLVETRNSVELNELDRILLSNDDSEQLLHLGRIQLHLNAYAKSELNLKLSEGKKNYIAALKKYLQFLKNDYSAGLIRDLQSQIVDFENINLPDKDDSERTLKSIAAGNFGIAAKFAVVAGGIFLMATASVAIPAFIGGFIAALTAGGVAAAAGSAAALIGAAIGLTRDMPAFIADAVNKIIVDLASVNTVLEQFNSENTKFVEYVDSMDSEKEYAYESNSSHSYNSLPIVKSDIIARTVQTQLERCEKAIAALQIKLEQQEEPAVQQPPESVAPIISEASAPKSEPKQSYAKVSFLSRISTYATNTIVGALAGGGVMFAAGWLLAPVTGFLSVPALSIAGALIGIAVGGAFGLVGSIVTCAVYDKYKRGKQEAPKNETVRVQSVPDPIIVDENSHQAKKCWAASPLSLVSSGLSLFCHNKKAYDLHMKDPDVVSQPSRSNCRAP